MRAILMLMSALLITLGPIVSSATEDLVDPSLKKFLIEFSERQKTMSPPIEHKNKVGVFKVRTKLNPGNDQVLCKDTRDKSRKVTVINLVSSENSTENEKTGLWGSFNDKSAVRFYLNAEDGKVSYEVMNKISNGKVIGKGLLESGKEFAKLSSKVAWLQCKHIPETEPIAREGTVARAYEDFMLAHKAHQFGGAMLGNSKAIPQEGAQQKLVSPTNSQLSAK
jgi:hypothetical protein